MSMTKITAALIAVLGFAGTANAEIYTIPAHSTKQITIHATSDFYISAFGFDSSDLDFRLISPVGRTLLEDVDGTSVTSDLIEIDSEGNFIFYVQNVGDEANAIQLDLEYVG
jgi:hypothetical protein